MTDQIPAGLTRAEAQAVREWAERSYAAEVQDETMYHAARVLLAVLPERPTLADMTDDERAACRRMQADVEGRSERYVIAAPYDGDADVALISPDWEFEWIEPECVTPRPDLRRMEWPTGEKQVEDVDPVKVGDVIESADDARISALPAGTVLRDREGEEATKFDVNTDPWRGPGYVPVAGDGTEFGPWTIARLPKKIDTVQESALAVGSAWRDADALARACEESGRDQIVVLNQVGYAFIWDEPDSRWEGYASPRTGPFTILHTGFEADQ